MKPKLSNTLPCFAIAHALLVIAVIVLIKVSHDPQAGLFFIIVFVANYPASIGIKYLSDIPTASGNMGDWLTFGIFLLLGSAWWFLLGWVISKLVSRGEATDHIATRPSS
ncbi:MAG TPA: hypothetical protein VGI45_13810 [Terracidiphilus sp.]